MSDTTQTTQAVAMPQVNVNDEEVTLVGWHVTAGQPIEAGQLLCEVETSKSIAEVPAPASGYFHPILATGDVVRIGQIIGFLGATAEAARDAALQESTHAATPTSGSATGRDNMSEANPSDSRVVDATAGAIALAGEHGLDLRAVRTTGRIRREDVERHLAEHGPPARPVENAEPVKSSRATASPGEAEDSLPAVLQEVVTADDPLNDHQWSIAQHLSRTRDRLVPAHVFMDVDMTAGQAWLDAQKQAGMMAGLVPLLLYAAAAAIAAQPRLAGFRLGRRVYRYRCLDIAYTARSADGRLFTPVVRGVGGKSLRALTEAYAGLNMAVFRGRIGPADLTGGCMTVSVLSDVPVAAHLGLQNAYQSALLTAGAIRGTPALIDGAWVLRPIWSLALAYDHGLLDGWEAAQALNAARLALEQLKS